MDMSSLKPALFLDRDGTVIVEKHYLSTPEGVELIPGVADALKQAKAAGYVIVIVTNQAGIGRGIYTVSDYDAVARKVIELLTLEGVVVDGTYYCPHHPDSGCDCRKPAPGMIECAIADLGIDAGQSVMIGDRETDILAGKHAGVGKTILVKTGYGVHEADTTSADYVADDVYDAISWSLQ